MRLPVLAVAAAMVAVPSVMLVARWGEEGTRPRTERPASFQMYSFVPPAAYEGTTTTGGVRRLDTDPLPPFVRAVDTGRLVPDRLCARHPDLAAVRRLDGPQPGTFTC